MHHVSHVFDSQLNVILYLRLATYQYDLNTAPIHMLSSFFQIVFLLGVELK